MSITPFENIHPEIHTSCYIAHSAEIIGSVTAARDSSFWPCSVVRGDVNKISIGTMTNIQDHSMLHVTHDSPYNPKGFPLIIGDYITIGHHVTLHGCTIDNYCLIGIGSIILDNVTIKSNTYIAAGSLVPPNKTLDSGYLWMGNPVKKHRKLTENEIEFIKYSAEHYHRLQKKYSTHAQD
ncbi:MAG: gamma carbonic anhydrase family protein [Francisellaceae bacterium]|jgi:carbonic anhydrase/acetyltransferase-like protein (isoleucine patch superfamily)|nr:gamma carbonic anhydrase family protein [Francisellaceae bacterium]MBT6206383.1 gamma carbonic anhydrase family protein [Francisellaceae bacterium]MBT6539790.1 gamma carbonic anhydrase family protein [Francisellaceae bacterium]